MKSIILFGFGRRGKKMVNTYLNRKCDFEIVAIADNSANVDNYCGIPVIRPVDICNYDYEEIWINTIYYEEIAHQLVSEYMLERDKIRYVEYPMIFLQNQIRTKYADEISGKKECDSIEKQEVIDYIIDNDVHMYCYPFFDEYNNRQIPVFYDDYVKLYYGEIDGKRMYLSRKFNTFKSAENYLRYTIMEQDSRSPHCYMSDDFFVDDDTVGIDVGAAEGIFALGIIDKVKHMYMVEVDEDWIEALKYTFKDYRDKITIIKSFVSNKSDDKTKRMDDLLPNQKIDFIKMDIEGEELKALEGCTEIIEKNSPGMAICTYHNKNDYEDIKLWLEQRGYETSHSKGFVICAGEWELDKEDVDFRRTIIWGRKA